MARPGRLEPVTYQHNDKITAVESHPTRVHDGHPFRVLSTPLFQVEVHLSLNNISICHFLNAQSELRYAVGSILRCHEAGTYRMSHQIGVSPVGGKKKQKQGVQIKRPMSRGVGVRPLDYIHRNGEPISLGILE